MRAPLPTLDLDDLLLAEEFTEDGATVLPERNRTPHDPGYQLTWRETRDRVETTRTGMVLCPGPGANNMWVVPDDGPHGDDGYAVLVRNVRAHPERLKHAPGPPHRRVGGVADWLSTAAWQTGRGLGPAYLRTDQLSFTPRAGGTTMREHTWLHAHPECPHPMARDRHQTAVRGEPVPVPEVRIYAQQYLHPSSRLPAGVARCRHCLSTDYTV